MLKLLTKEAFGTIGLLFHLFSILVKDSDDSSLIVIISRFFGTRFVLVLQYIISYSTALSENCRVSRLGSLFSSFLCSLSSYKYNSSELGGGNCSTQEPFSLMINASFRPFESVIFLFRHTFLNSISCVQNLVRHGN
jgi:hypothetical protein